MLGAIAGDVIGSVFEHHPANRMDFPLFSSRSRFTDDTVLTVATAHALLLGAPYQEMYHRFGNAYKDAGYGAAFRRWLRTADKKPYQSWGNGSAMRVGPIGLAAPSREWAIAEAGRSAAVTHDHPEGIKGAEAVALAVFLAKQRASKDDIRKEVAKYTGYDLSRTVAGIRESGYQFDVSCAGSVPEAIIAFLEGDSFEQVVRLAIWLGGDADTQAAIAGSIAEAYWGGVPAHIKGLVDCVLDAEIQDVTCRFYARFPMK